MASTVRSSSSTAPRIRSASSPGSKITARSAPSRRAMKQFSATGPTVNIRTSMPGVYLVCVLFFITLAHPAAEGERVDRVEGGRIDRPGDQCQPDGAADRGIQQQHEQQEEADGRDRTACDRAAPGRRCVQLLLALLLRRLADLAAV